MCQATRCFVEQSPTSSPAAPAPVNSCGKCKKSVNTLFYFKSWFCFALFFMTAVCLTERPFSPPRRAGLRVPCSAVSRPLLGAGGDGDGAAGTAPQLGRCRAAEGALCGPDGAVLPCPRAGPGAGAGRAGAVQPRRGRGQGRARAALPPAAAMAGGSEKVPIARVGPDDVELCLTPVSAAGWHRAGQGGIGTGWVWVGVERDRAGRDGRERVGSGQVAVERGGSGQNGSGRGLGLGVPARSHPALRRRTRPRRPGRAGC